MKRLTRIMIAAVALALTVNNVNAQYKDETTGFDMPKLNPSSRLADLSGSHVGIRVPDYEAARKWWTEKLDFRVIHEWPCADPWGNLIELSQVIPYQETVMMLLDSPFLRTQQERR